MLTESQFALLHYIKTHPATNPFTYEYPCNIILNENLRVYHELVALDCLPKIRSGVRLAIKPRGIAMYSEHVAHLEELQRLSLQESRQREAQHADAEHLQEIAQYHEKSLANRDASRSWFQFALSYILSNLSHLYDAVKNLIH